MQDLLDLHVDMARELVSTSAEVMPRFLVRGRTGKISVIMAQWESEQQKDAVAELVRETARHELADLVLFMSETWTAEGEAGKRYIEGRAAGKWRDLSEFPERQDAMMFIAETKQGHKLGQAPIITTKGKRSLGEVKWRDDGAPSGRFTNLLPKEKGAA